MSQGTIVDAAGAGGPGTDLEGIEALWHDGLGSRYTDFLEAAGHLGEEGPQVALAAALVETALGLQGLGGAAAEPAPLLLADLCLARASRLLADAGDQRLQIGFAQAVEHVAAAAAAGEAPEPVRQLLLSVIER